MHRTVSTLSSLALVAGLLAPLPAVADDGARLELAAGASATGVRVDDGHCGTRYLAPHADVAGSWLTSGALSLRFTGSVALGRLLPRSICPATHGLDGARYVNFSTVGSAAVGPALALVEHRVGPGTLAVHLSAGPGVSYRERTTFAGGFEPDEVVHRLYPVVTGELDLTWRFTPATGLRLAARVHHDFVRPQHDRPIEVFSQRPDRAWVGLGAVFRP